MSESRERSAGRWVATALLPAALLAAGCGDASAPVAVQRGSAEALLQDDPLAAEPSVASGAGDRASLPVSGESHEPHALRTTGARASASEFTGTLAGDVKVAISADGSDWVDLGSFNGITIPLQSAGARTSVHGQVSVPFGTYRWVRLSVRDAEVTVEEGGTVGGTVLSDEVKLDLGVSAPVVVEKRIPAAFTVDERTGVIVLAELNSELWVTETALQLGAVPAAAVRDAVAFRVQSEARL